MATTFLGYRSNTTCDIYHGANVPPSPPDVAGVALYLEEAFANIKPTAPAYDHIAHFAVGVDVRDGDKLYVSDRNGVRYDVQFVARRGRGSDMDHKVAYCTRNSSVSWPTDNL